MKKEVILVPKDKNFLNFLEELKEKIGEEQFKKSWIYLHDDFPYASRRRLAFSFYSNCGNVWSHIQEVILIDEPEKRITFEREECEDPEYIFFLKSEK